MRNSIFYIGLLIIIILMLFGPSKCASSTNLQQRNPIVQRLEQWLLSCIKLLFLCLKYRVKIIKEINDGPSAFFLTINLNVGIISF